MSDTSEMIQQQISEMTAAEAEAAQEATNEPTEGEATPEVENEAQETEEKPNKANKEAAKYRTQLREAEGKLEAMTATLDTYRAREVTEVVSKMLTLETAQDYFAVSGTSLADYLSEDGTVDTARVQEATRKFREERPAYRPKIGGMPAYDPTQGLGNGYRSGGAQWSDLFEH